MILCATAMHTTKEVYPSSGCPSWKRYTKVHSGARTSNCEQRWDLQPRTSHRVLTESCPPTNWPSNNHEAGQIFLRIVPDSHNWGRGERRKILTFQQHSPSIYSENNHRAFFSRLENCPREKSVPSCRSSNRQKLDQGKPSRVTNRRERHRR